MPWLNWLRTPSGLAWAGGPRGHPLRPHLWHTHLSGRVSIGGPGSVATEEPLPRSGESLTITRPAASTSQRQKSTSSAKEKSPLPKMTQEAKRETPAKRQRADAAKQAPAENMHAAAEQPRLSEDRARPADAPSPAAPAAAPVPRPAPRIIRHSSASAGPKRPCLYYGGAPSAGAAVKAEEQSRGAGSPTVLGCDTALHAGEVTDKPGSQQAIAARSRGTGRLLVETTQDGYLQLPEPRLCRNAAVVATARNRQISLKAVARTRTDIPCCLRQRAALLIWSSGFHPNPSGPLTMQEVGMLDRFQAISSSERSSPATPPASRSRRRTW